MRITANSLALVLLPALGVLACAQQAGEEGAGEMEMAMAFDVAAVRAAISEAQTQFLAGIAAGDAASIAALYTADATVIPPNAEAVSGKVEIQEFWAGFMAEGLEDLSLRTLDVGGAGDVAFEIGEYSGMIGGEADRGNYVIILKRDADGAWKMYADIFNSDLPLE